MQELSAFERIAEERIKAASTYSQHQHIHIEQPINPVAL